MVAAWEWELARHFLVVGNRAWTDGIRLDDLPGAGRCDALCRAVTSALWLSHGLRQDTRLHLLLLGPPCPPRLVSFHPGHVRRMNPDERNVGSHLRIVLSRAAGLRPGECVRGEPGISVRAVELAEILAAASAVLPVWFLDRGGVPFQQRLVQPAGLYVLGDHQGLTEEQRGSVARYATGTLSISNLELLASHAIVLVHGHLDTQFRDL